VGNGVGVSGAVMLTISLKMNKVLKELDLADNSLKDQGVKAIAEVLEGSSLVSLKLG